MTPHRLAPTGRHLIGAAFLLLALVLVAGCSSTPKAAEKPATTGQYAFWPPYPDEPRIQFLASFQHSGQVAERKENVLADIVYGKESNREAAVNKPYGVEMWNGRIYTCDIRGGEVMVFDLRKKQTRVMGTTGRETLVQPTDIAISEDGTKYVADVGRNLVLVFDADERFVTVFGLKDFQPRGVAVYKDRLYVTDFAGHCVQILNRQTGELIGQIGEQGSEDGQFVRPLGVDVDPEGNIYVTDVIRCRVQEFSPDGKLLNAFGQITNNIGEFVRPKHIAVDRDQIVYVVDSAFQNVQLFTPKGEILTFFGAPGTHPGAMFLPVGIAVHYGDLDLFAKYVHPAFEAKYLILVTNQFSENKVSVYAFGQLRPGHTVEETKANQADIPLGTEDVNKGNETDIGDQPEPGVPPVDDKPKP